MKSLKVNMNAVLLLILSLLASCHGWEADLPKLTLQIQSTSPSSPGSLLNELLQETTIFLDLEFIEHFSTNVYSKDAKEDTFSHVNLRVDNYDLGDVPTGGVMATVDFKATTYFNDLPVPSEAYMTKLLQSSFLGQSRLDYVGRLQQSEDVFLAGITYLVVSVDDTIIANEDLASSPSNDDGDDDLLVMVLIASCVGCGIVLVGCVGIFCFLSRRKQLEENDATVTEIDTKKSNTDIDIELASTRSPSPVHSLISQESSKFTYNPRSRGSQEESTVDSKSIPSNFSSLQVDVSQAINIEAWKNSTISPITPAPFGNDISAIEVVDKRDLSLIEEDSDEDATPARLSKDSLTRMNTKKPLSLAYTSSMLNDTSMQSEDVSLQSDESDVIMHLKDLSVQFRDQRDKNSRIAWM